MEKVQLSGLKIDEIIKRSEDVIATGDHSMIVKLNDKKLLKLYRSEYLNNIIIRQLTESKILLADNYRDLDILNVPTGIVYHIYNFCGYIMTPEVGPTYTEYFFSLPQEKKEDINTCTDLFLKVNSSVKKVNKRGILVPDLCTTDNIILRESDNKAVLLDWDGIQVGKIPPLLFSSSLGNEAQYMTPKYYNKVGKYFNNNIDKKSLAILYFQTVLGCDLEKSMVNYVMQEKNIDKAVRALFEEINLKDEVFARKIANMYKQDRPNEYIGGDVQRIAENYRTIIVESYYTDGDLQAVRKRLERK